MFPLRARPGGVLERRGQTEAAVDLAGLAGLYPAGVICEIVNDDGTMARVPDLIRFCKTHGLVMVTVADLARYRLESEYEESLWAIDGSFTVCLRHPALAARSTMKGENMTQLKSSQSAHASGDQAAIGRLFVLDLSGNRVLSLNPDGSDRKVIVHECRMPDGIAVDVEAGHIYWTNMGVPNLNDGSIERADLDGRNRKTIVPQGGTFTPKQLQLEKRSGKLYWSDREGMRVMRANLDGSEIETLVETGQGDADRRDQTKWCVGIAVDAGADNLLDAKRPGRRGIGPHLSREHRNPEG